MELVRTAIQLEFKEVLNPWLEMRDLVRVAGEKPDTELNGSPLILDVKDKKERVEIRFRSIFISQEAVKTVDESIENVIKRLREFDKFVKTNRYTRVVSTTQFIDPYSIRFNELFSLIKLKFVKENPITEPITDIGIVFDQRDGKVLKHTQFGPMDKEQLQSQYLHFERKSIPDIFVYLENSCETSDENIYNSTNVTSFLTDSIKWQFGYSEKLFNYLHEVN